MVRIRRLTISFIFIILLTALIVLAETEGAPADSWSMFRGTHSLTGISNAVLPEKLKLRWSYQADDSIESSAAIVNGTVYFGSMDGSLNAVSLADGKPRWRYAVEYTTPDSSDTFASYIQESSPCVSNGMVYVGDLNGTLHAVDARTGKVKWTFKTDGEIKSSPNCYDNRIYFGSYDTYLYCLAADTGELIWKFATEGPVHSTPSISQGKVFVSGCDETFRAIDVKTGEQLYALPLGGYTGASAAIRGSNVFVGTFTNEVISIDLGKRILRWSYMHETRNFPFYSSAAVTDRYVVVGGRDKIVHCLDSATGKEVWAFTTRSRVESSPLITGNRVFVGSNDGNLYELDLKTGKKVWDFVAGAPLSASPAAAQGSLVIGSQDGVLYCFGK